jgi:hypothetical protein
MNVCIYSIFSSLEEDEKKDISNSPDDLVILPQSSSDLFEIENESIQRSIHAENNIQRLDKLFTRTVTGVFNTIKTAVGGDAISDVMAGYIDNNAPMYKHVALVPLIKSENWLFVADTVDVSSISCKLCISTVAA